MAKRSKSIFYKSYNFVDKDPVIDIVRSVVDGVSYKDISEDSGVSTTTLYNWFNGTTRRPQFATVSAVVRSQGQEFVLTTLRGRKRA